MPKRFRLTRRFPVAMTEDGYRKINKVNWEESCDRLICLFNESLT
jgi:hypothetical protein